MDLPKKLKNKHIEMDDFYALKIKTLWEGLKQEHVSFWLLCIYFFFEYVRPQSIYPAIDILPYPKIVLGMAIIAAFMDPSVKWVSNIGNKLMVIFAAVVVLSGVFAFRPMVSLDNYVFFLNWLLVYFLVVCIVNTEKRLFLFLCAFFLFNLKMSQHGFFSWAGRGFSFSSWGLAGAPGWFRNSAEFAIEMLIFMPLSTALIIALKVHWGRVKKWVMYFLPVSAAFSIIGSSSRGGQLGLAAVALWLLLKSRLRFKAIVVMGVIGLVLYYFLPAEQIARFQDAGTDETSLQRLVYWNIGLQIMNDHPILGIGYFNWRDYMHIHYPEGVGPLEMDQIPHNTFIHVGAEQGYTGLFVFLAMIITVFVLNASTRKLVKDKNILLFYLAYGLDAGLVGFLVSGFFVSILYYPFFWVQIALTVTVHSVTRANYGYVRKADGSIRKTRLDSNG